MSILMEGVPTGLLQFGVLPHGPKITYQTRPVRTKRRLGNFRHVIYWKILPVSIDIYFQAHPSAGQTQGSTSNRQCCSVYCKLNFCKIIIKNFLILPSQFSWHTVRYCQQVYCVPVLFTCHIHRPAILHE